MRAPLKRYWCQIFFYHESIYCFNEVLFAIDGEIKIILESDECSFVNELGSKRNPKPWRNENETMCCESEIVLDTPDYSEVDKLETASIPSWGSYNSLLYAITQIDI